MRQNVVDQGESLEQRDQRLDVASGRVVRLCVGLAVANGCLMALLGAHPFADPAAQLAAGSCAIGLHGWGAWEVGAALMRWSAASAALAQQAAGAVRAHALERARPSKPGPGAA